MFRNGRFLYSEMNYVRGKAICEIEIASTLLRKNTLRD